MDWGEGGYEHIAEGVLPAAELVVDVAAPLRGEFLVDLGCGDGNAALLAAARGARVTGIDPSSRLLELATRRVAGRSLDVTFREGAADAMPLADASADVIISVFGVIFAPDAEAAAREMARVLAPAGRIVLSAWHPTGAIGDAARVRREAVGNPTGPPPFAWHEHAALRELFEPYGFTVSVAEASLPFTASSAQAWAQTEFRHHPAWAEAERILDEPALAKLQQEVTQLLAEANEDPNAFRVTSDYVVATMSTAV